MVLGMMPEIKVGDPRDPETWIGPIRVERTRQLLDRALTSLDDPRFLFRPAGTASGRGLFWWRSRNHRTWNSSGPF